MNKALNLFDWLNEITFNKSSWDKFSENDIKIFNVYMIHRYLSMDPNYIELVNYVQKFPQNNKQNIYSIYKGLIPKKKVLLRYIGSKKQQTNNDLINIFCSYFELSKREVIDYIEILPKNKIIDILSSLGKDEEEIKNLTSKL